MKKLFCALLLLFALTLPVFAVGEEIFIHPESHWLMMEGDKVFKTKELSHQIGSSRLSFAGAEEMEQFLDITPGSLSVLGLVNDKNMQVRLIIDAPVLDSEYIGVHPCINTSSLRLKTADVMDKIIPAMGHEPKIVNLPAAE